MQKLKKLSLIFLFVLVVQTIAHRPIEINEEEAEEEDILV
jgi:hypothetical protein